MPLDDKLDSVRSKLDQSAVETVLTKAQRALLPSSADRGAEELAFADGVYRYASTWLSNNDGAVSKPFAFVLSRSIAEDEKRLIDSGVTGFNNYQAFKNQKMIDVTSHVIIATMNLERALTLPVPAVTDAQTLLNAIKKLGFDDRYVAAIEPPAANLILLMPGFDTSRSIGVELIGSSKPWSLKALEDEISKFHSAFTRTPSGFLVPWRSAAKGITGDQLEVRISKYLAYELGRIWPSGSILAEATTSSGRIDVFLQGIVLEEGRGPCVVEIKVLRSHSNRKKLPDDFCGWWAKKGAVQANLYRQDIGANSAYLLCFDARDADAPMPDIETVANTLSVTYHKYFMYRSSNDLQAVELAKLAKT